MRYLLTGIFYRGEIFFKKRSGDNPGMIFPGSCLDLETPGAMKTITSQPGDTGKS